MSPNGMTSNSNRSSWQFKAVFSPSFARRGTWQYPAVQSRVEKNWASPSESSQSSMLAHSVWLRRMTSCLSMAFTQLVLFSRFLRPVR